MRDFYYRNMTLNCMVSDESPLTCEMFLDEGGLELFLTVLRVSACNCRCYSSMVAKPWPAGAIYVAPLAYFSDCV